MTPSPLAERRLYTLDEAAVFFRKSPRWVWNKIKAGELKGIWMPQWHLAGPDLDEYIRRRRKDRPT